MGHRWSVCGIEERKVMSGTYLLVHLGGRGLLRARAKPVIASVSYLALAAGNLGNACVNFSSIY